MKIIKQTGIDTSDATATPATIIAPYTAYVNGVKITGTGLAGISYLGIINETIVGTPVQL